MYARCRQIFLEQQQRSIGVSDEELIRIAIKSMGLDELADFNPEEKLLNTNYMARNDSAN